MTRIRHLQRSPWHDVVTLATTGSTNADVLALAAGQAGPGDRSWVVVTAGEQTAGRGRLGRSWASPAGTSVAVSALVPTVAGPALGWLPLVTGLAVADAIDEVAGIDAVLKWPNDVLLPRDEERKVCGILCELSERGVVIGFGVNLTQSREQLPVPTATSLALVSPRLAEGLGMPADDALATDLVEACLDGIARWHAALEQGGPVGSGARAAYLDRCVTVGRDVRVELPGVLGGRSGRAVDVDEQGRLVVEHAGACTAFAAGDVVHVRPDGQAAGAGEPSAS